MKTVRRKGLDGSDIGTSGQEKQMSTLWLSLKVFAIVALGIVGVIGIQI